MSPRYPAVPQGAPQFESSSRKPAITSTHDETIVTLVVRQTGRSPQDNGSKVMTPISWEKIPDELPPDQGPNSSDWGETDCAGRSNFAYGASLVSADNAETLSGCNGDLDQTDTVSPRTTNHAGVEENIHPSRPNPISNEGLKATTKIVTTKPLFRKEDRGPS